jgi:hypothetical protein
VQLEADSYHAMEAGRSARAGNSSGLNYVQISLSPERSPISQSADGTGGRLRSVASEWATGNYVRIALILTAVVLVMLSVIRIARETAPEHHD